MVANTEILQGVADHYKVGFEQDYEESGSLIYGMATYRDSVLVDTYLDADDWDAYDFDEETDTCHFEGEEYESDCEILETLLERKISAL